MELILPILKEEECMKNKRLLGCAVLLIFLGFPAYASMVSFIVVETGLNEEASSPQYSSLWEGALMSVFFDAGHIVTNCPIGRIEKKPSSDLSGTLKADFDEAVLGGAEYFILGFLEYQAQKSGAIPREITIKIYRTDSKALVFEQNFPAGTGKNLNEEYQLAQNAGRIIIAHVKDW